MVAPGADPNAIALEIETGNSKLEKPNWKLEKRNWKSENGGKRAISRQWSVAANEGRRTTDAVNPKSQIQNRKSVDGRYVLLADNRVGFEVGAYDKTLPLIIDPVLTYGTYLGGTNEDRAYAVAADSSGNAYVAGVSYSSDFPTTPGAFDPVHVLQRGCEVGDIVNMAAIAVVHAQASVEQLPLRV